jgi:hypothetical protein
LNTVPLIEPVFVELCRTPKLLLDDVCRGAAVTLMPNPFSGKV